MASNAESVTIQWINDSKEHGLIANRQIADGEVIFNERPLACAQYLFNQDFFPACTHCMKSLESPGEMVRRLAGLEENLQLPQFDPLKQTAAEEPLLHCHACEKARYCSEECRRQSWEQYHNLLCLANDKSASHPLIKLEELWKSFHFPPESATITLVTRIIASVVNQVNHGVPVEDAMAVYSEFKSQYHNPDIDVLHTFFEGKLDGEISKIQQLIRDALYDPRVDELFSEQGFRQLMGVIALNGQGIGTSALEHYQRRIQTYLEDEEMSLDRESMEIVLDQIESLEPIIEEVSGEFTHCEGSGLYRLHSKINHSCVPNAVVQFPDNSSELQVVAIRQIEQGEEICISYVELDDCGSFMGESDDDEDAVMASPSIQALNNRREMLRKFYLFECNCSACASIEEVAGK